jgi:predicted RNA-binding Zn ribbon-like protein
MPRKPPRYDLPNSAPEPLAHVQRFVNTCDPGHASEWLEDWLAGQGLDELSPAEVERARALREAIRELLLAHNHQTPARPDPDFGALGATADGALLTIDFAAPALVARAAGLDGVLGGVVIACLEAMRNGTWGRLKCCRNSTCRWAFYDYSRNRSASWCSMQICGNRTKTRSYRQRRRAVGDA